MRHRVRAAGSSLSFGLVARCPARWRAVVTLVLATTMATTISLADARPALAESDGFCSEPGTPIDEQPVALRQWGLHEDDTRGYSLFEPRGEGVVVAVIDQGVGVTSDHFNPDVYISGVESEAVLPGVSFIPGDKSRGRADTEEHYHGTAVASIIAARAVSGSHLVGVAPGARILPIRLQPEAGEKTAEEFDDEFRKNIARGVRYATDFGAQVINISISSPTDDPALRSAVAYAHDHGVLVVASAGNVATGNSGDAAEEEPDVNAVRYPAAYPEVLGVTASDVETLTVTDDSYHGEQVDIAAPGNHVLIAGYDNTECTTGSIPASSWSTAFVSGVAAAVVERYPDAGPDYWQYRILVTAQRQNPYQRDDVNGWGVIQPEEAIYRTTIDQSLPGPPMPSATVRASEPPIATDSPDIASITGDASEASLVPTAWVIIGIIVITLAALIAQIATHRISRRHPHP